MMLLTGKILQRSGQVYLSLFRGCHHRRTNFAALLNPARRKVFISGIGKRFLAEAKIASKEAAARKKPDPGEYKRLFLLALPEKWKLLGAVVLLFVSSGVTMAIPFWVGKVIDMINAVDKDKMRENINQISLWLLAVLVVGGACNFGRYYLMHNSAYRITQRLRKNVYSAIMRQETAMFDRVSTGELVGRLSGDAQVVSTAITSNVSDGLRSGITALAGSSMMFYTSPKLAFVGLSMVVPVAAMAIVYSRFVKKISKQMQDNLATLSTTAEEKISNIRTVKCFGQEGNEINKYDSKLRDLLQVCYKDSLYRGLFFGASGFSGNVITLSVLYYGGFMITDETLTAGTLGSFLLYAIYVGLSMNTLTNFFAELNRAVGASSRLFDLIQKVPELPIQGGLIPQKRLSGDVVFQNLKFAYPTRKDVQILDNFNLRVQSGSSMAIVGPSGSGKSTLALLLLRLYDPDHGSILLDGYDLRKLDPLWVKSQIGIVSQEPMLFNATIRENICYGKEDASKEEISDAISQANVTEFVNKLPKGLDTLVGERGVTLSGGQRQRVVIARALIKNPKILVLDEATSALDAQSEFLVQEALERVTQGRTVLTIAHRLSTIKNADTIAVLSQGEVMETGSYDELIAKNGLFKKLVKHQTFG